MNRITKLLLTSLTLLVLSACGGGGDSAPPPTDPATVFQLFPTGRFTPGNTDTINLTGTDTVGGVYTAIFSMQTQSESTFLGVPAIPILVHVQITNTASGAVASNVGNAYYTPLATDRHYLGFSDSTSTTVSSITEAIPQTGKIGDFGVIGTYTDNAGDVDVQTWRIDDGGGGNANIVELSTERDQFGNPTTSSVTTTKIDVNGNMLSIELILFYADTNITVTLSGS